MQQCDENNGSSPLSSHLCELQELFWSGQRTPKLKKNTILMRVYINQHKILINVTVFTSALHLCFTCLFQKSELQC